MVGIRISSGFQLNVNIFLNYDKPAWHVIHFFCIWAPSKEPSFASRTAQLWNSETDIYWRIDGYNMTLNMTDIESGLCQYDLESNLRYTRRCKNSGRGLFRNIEQ